MIINPAAGQDDPARLKRVIGGAFAARSASFDIAETEHAGHATALAQQAAGLGYRAVAVVGGDGTIAEAATGLAGSDTPLAVIPRGTANQVPRNLGIPLDIEGAVEVAVNGTPAPLDLGCIGDRRFALAAGAGYDAAVMSGTSRELKERFGLAAYLIAALREALNLSPTRFRIVADGRELEVSAVSVMLANMAELFAGILPLSFPLNPERGPAWQDGMLDVVILAPRGLTGVPELLWRAARRNFGGNQTLIHFRASEIEIHTDTPIAVQIDGDAAGTTPIVASTIRHGIHVLVP